MKATTRTYVRTSSITVLTAVASLAGAQTPPPAEASPPAPPASGAAASAPAMPAPDTSPEHTSYLFGLTFGEQLHSVGITSQVDQDAIARGLKDGLGGKKSTRADQQQIQGFVRTVMTETVARNKQAATDFLEHNGHEKGVKTTPDGLEYKILIPGNAKAAAIQPSDEVTVHYRGKLLDGSEFDSSYAHGAPVTFRVNGVIKGWQEALVLMKPGAKWELFIPPDLGYGATPHPGIPAGSLLVFDIELISVKPAEAPPAAGAPGTPPGHMTTQPMKPAANGTTGTPPPAQSTSLDHQ